MFKFLKSAGQKYIDIQKRNFDAIKDVFDGDDEQALKAEVITKEARDMGLGGDYRAVVEGETVKLEGKVPDQETLEKIVLTSGFTGPAMLANRERNYLFATKPYRIDTILALLRS